NVAPSPSELSQDPDRTLPRSRRPASALSDNCSTTVVRSADGACSSSPADTQPPVSTVAWLYQSSAAVRSHWGGSLRRRVSWASRYNHSLMPALPVQKPRPRYPVNDNTAGPPCGHTVTSRFRCQSLGSGSLQITLARSVNP